MNAQAASNAGILELWIHTAILRAESWFTSLDYWGYPTNLELIHRYLVFGDDVKMHFDLNSGGINR